MKRSLGYLVTALPLVVSSLAIAKDRPLANAFADAPSTVTLARGRTSAAPPPATVTSVDPKRGIPTMLFADPGANPPPSSLVPEVAAREHLTRHASRYGLSAAALASASVVSVHDTGRGGILVTLRQSIDGVELYRHDAKVLMDRELRLVAIGGNLHASPGTSRKQSFVLPDAQALALALGDLYEAPVAVEDLVRSADMDGGYHTFTLSPGAKSLTFHTPARIKRVYYPLPDRVVAAYFLEVSARTLGSSSTDVYAYVIAADDGRILHRANLTHDAKFSYRLWADTTGDLRPQDGPLADYTPYPAPAPNHSYPDLVPSSLIAIDGFNATHDPWLPDTATQTQGNNVDAYTDDDQPDGFSKNDTRAHVSSPGVFDYSYDFTQAPTATLKQRMSSVTSLFYVTNWLHDWWYDSGFDEKGMNAQADNLGRGGLGGDALQAQAQNGTPQERNNSNMSVPGDGMAPVMQMFVWDGKGSASITSNGGTPQTNVGTASFGPKTFDVTGDLIIADDGTAPNDDVCQAITNDLTGKIAIVRRGTCTFVSKAKAVEAAGAVGVIFFDSVQSLAPPDVGGQGATAVKIPILSLTMADGMALETAVTAGPITAEMKRALSHDRDGTIDNTVVGHEWGHYLHLRNVDCNTQMCGAESEGWADFNALMLVVRDGDNYDGAYALAVHAVAAFPGDPAYFGIRRVPYSTDFTKDPLTFKHIADASALPTTAPIADNGSPHSEAHAAGEIWASMMFEAYVALLKIHPYEEAHRRMGDYVVLGMRTAPTDPTYLEQRDAILAAAVAAKADDDVTAIAKAFARRGAGSCAVSPPRDSMDNAGVVEDFDVKPIATLVDVAIDDSVHSCDNDGLLDVGETGKVTVNLRNVGIGMVTGATATVTSTSPGVTFPSGATITFPAVGSFVTAKGTIDIALGSAADIDHLGLSVKLSSTETCAATADLTANPTINYDDLSTGLTVDSVESKTTNWTLSGDFADQIWARVQPPMTTNHVWAALDAGLPTDSSLVSPALVVSGTDNLVLNFTHRYQFEFTMGVAYDGAVIEVSSDGGMTWDDISKYGDPGYTGTIGDPSGAGQQALKMRKGFIDHNKSYPMTDKVTVDMGKSLAGKTIQVRFRVGSDDQQDAPGWELDNIGFTGITNAPFSGLTPNKVTCGGAGGAGGAGGGGGQAGAPAGGASGKGGTSAQGGAGAGGASASAGSGGTTSGTGGHVAAGGTGQGGAGGSASPSGSAITPAVEPDGSGCGCETAPARTPGMFGLALLSLAAIVGRRRRRAL